MRAFFMTVFAVAMTPAAAAHAQESPAPPPSSSLPGSPGEMMRGPDEFATELDRLRNQAGRPGFTQSVQPVPVTPADVTAGSSVRDSRGAVMGTIERVGDGFAVVATTVGKIEVEFPSIAKNSRGLLINMTKSKFYKVVAGAAKN